MKYDFFISRNSADREWAQWIAWQLKAQGMEVRLQDWHFRAGNNFVLEMHRAAQDSERTIVVLSDDYLAAEYTQPEWAAAWADDPQGIQRKVVPVRVKECTVAEGLLKGIAYIDLVPSTSEEDSRTL